MTENVKHLNYLCNTNFKECKITNVNKQFGKYNVDIVFDGDAVETSSSRDGKKYILEVDGIYFHGLIDSNDNENL